MWANIDLVVAQTFETIAMYMACQPIRIVN